MSRGDHLCFHQRGQSSERAAVGIKQGIAAIGSQGNDLFVLRSGDQPVMLDQSFIIDIGTVDALEGPAGDGCGIVALRDNTVIGQLFQRYQAGIEQIVQGNPILLINLFNKVKCVKIGFGHHGGNCGQSQVDIIKTVSINNPFLRQVGKLGGRTAVTDDQLVYLQLAQLDQVADIDDLDKVVQEDLVGADVVVEIALLKQGRIFQVADIQLDVGDVTQVAVVDIALLDQILQGDLIVIKGDQTVERNRGNVGIVDIHRKLSLEKGNVEVDIIEVMNVDEACSYVSDKGHVI